MVPIVDCNHWSLAVLSDHAFLKFDSRPSASVSFHGSTKLHECLGQVWCMAMGQSEGTSMWEESSDIRTWIHVQCPKQEDGWSCGYYVMCFLLSDQSPSLRGNQVGCLLYILACNPI